MSGNMDDESSATQVYYVLEEHSGSTLLPMLIGGLVLIILGMIGVVVFA